MIEFFKSENYNLIEDLDAGCFPLDVPADYSSAEWWVGFEYDIPACFCAWKVIDHDEPVGFLYRAGVVKSFRGRQLQTRMIRLRETLMLARDLTRSVTYTDADGVASMRNLIDQGYLPYLPTDQTRLSGSADRLGRVGFVHWSRSLVD